MRSRADLRAFIELPYRLHANGTPWIPQLRLERRLFLSRRFNAFFKHGDAQLFLARRGDRVVGRISAQVDRAFNAYQQNDWGMFGFLELEDDQETMDALLEAAYGWLREQGRDRAVGPMDFTMLDECGVLVDGYERPPMVRQPWHPPYYRELCERAGLEKVVDLFMWELHISGKENVLPVIWELAEKVESEHGIKPAPDEPPLAPARTSTCSPRSTTKPGRGTGASCRSRSRTSTRTPRSSTSCSIPTGS